MKTATLVLGLASAILPWAAPVRAAPVAYIEQTTATGSLDGVPFTNASILLTVTSDTANVVSLPGGVLQIEGTETVVVNGGLPETFIGRTGVNTANSRIGSFFSGATIVILDISNPIFANYDLTTSIGPGSGPVIFNPGFSFPTSSGNFILEFIPSGTATFTAVVSTAVPEPSSLTLLGMAFVWLRLVRRRPKIAA